MSKRFLLKIIISNIVIGFMVYVIVQNRYSKMLNDYQGKNILNDPQVAWGAGWEDYQSRYGGSEFRFILVDSSKISFKISSLNKEQGQGQGIEIFIDGTVYIHELPNLDEKELTVYLSNKTLPHTIRVRHFCSGSYSPCEITLKSMVVDKSATLFTPPKIPQKKMAVLGDSISVGWGRGNFFFIVADRLGYQLHNASIFESTVSRKSNADWVIARYKKDIVDYKPDVVVSFLGTNDVSQNVPLEKFENDYSELVKGIKSALPDSVIVNLGILRRKDIEKKKIEQYTKVIKKVSALNNVLFLDTYDWLNENDLMDVVHPNHVSQITLANKLNTELSSILKK